MITTTANAVTVRWMVRRDIPQIVGAWTHDDIVEALRQRNTIGMVAEDACGNVCAAMLYELHLECIDIVDVWGTERGCEEVLLNLVARFKKSHRPRLMMTVVETYDLLLLIMRRVGFRATKLVRGDVGDRDGIVMEITKEQTCQVVNP